MIKVSNLTKTYRVLVKKENVGFLKGLYAREEKKIEAVRGIDFEIDDGELIGFIGLNGAGKSTTIKMLCGLIYPDSGNIEVNGLVPFKDKKKNNMNMGVMFGQTRQLWFDLPIKDSLELMKVMYKVSDSDFERNFNYLNEYLEVDNFLNIPAKKLSLGQRIRCEIMGSLIHWPKFVYLDEPTIGVDILTRQRVLKMIKELSEVHRKTIIFTSHNLYDVEDICKRIIIINQGKIVYDGETKNLKKKYSTQKTIKIVVTKNHEYNEDKKTDILNRYKDINLKIENNLITAEFKVFDGKINNLLLFDIGAIYNIVDYETNEISFESIIADMYINKEGEFA